MKKYILGIFLFFAPLLVEAQYTKKLPFPPPKSSSELPPSALIKTTKGDFEVELFRKSAPIAVKNFEYLAKKGLYTGSYFKNYVDGKYIQGGAAKRKPNYLLPPEITDLKNVAGTLGMAAPPKQINPERLMDGMQFYITHERRPRLDGQYTIFGQIIWGLERAKLLRPGDQITAIKFPKSYSEINPRSTRNE